MIVAMLAILKAGGAYVWLDPTYPSDRLAFVVEDTGLRFVLGLEEPPRSPAVQSAGMILLDRDWTDIGQKKAGDLRTTVQNTLQLPRKLQNLLEWQALEKNHPEVLSQSPKGCAGRT